MRNIKALIGACSFITLNNLGLVLAMRLQKDFLYYIGILFTS